jgi:tetratricopeptide (TPR) repeat protein
MTNKNEIILQFDRLKPEAEFDASVPVRVKFSTEDSEVFDFINPITDKNLAELRWYLESYWQWPSDIDDDRAREVEGNLPKWGKALMDAIIQKSPDAMRLFGRFSEAQGERMLTIDTTEPRILRLPWELLRDEGGYLFSEKISVRRRMHKVKPQEIQPFDLPVRILMVTCRPDGAGFIDPRSIATPLLDALDSLPEDFEVEFLRPPTLKALDKRLRDETQPQIHIVHFDGHGAFDKKEGLGLLLFEDDEHAMHLVKAEQIGTLLNKSGIPLMVLNACQSAQSDDKNPLASVAARLIESGVGGVVAMNYSVLVETAKRFTKEFYGALARGQSANAAMDTARRDLFADTKRLTLRRPNEEEATIIHLQDWFLPALYQQADELIPFAPLASPHLRQKATKMGGTRGAFPPPPLHGFHGRARELLDLERAFATRDIVVLHGFGGQGKTSLATQAAEWFTRTRLFDRAAFISFETGASLDFVLNELGNALVEENFQIHQGDKVEAIAQSLQEKPALVVFDNFESALPGGNAPMPELQALLDAASKWFAPSPVTRHSSLLITTRNTDIPHPAFTPSNNCIHKELSGLAPSDALELAASLLEAYSLPRPPRVPLEELLTFLKGHPLSLQLALPQLRDYSAGQLVEQYQSILPQMKKGEAKERNESLEVSLRFSLDRLGEEAKTLLTRLAVFEGGALEPALLDITEIPEEIWNIIKPQLASTALIRVEDIPDVDVSYIHFHPTLTPYLRGQLPSFLQENGVGIRLDDGNLNRENWLLETEKRYWRSYYQFVDQLYHADSQIPFHARALIAIELPNLRRALKLALVSGSLDDAVDFADSIIRFLNNFSRWRERDEIVAEVEKATRSKQKTENAGVITQSEYLLESGRGERLLQQGRARQAEMLFRTLLQRLESDDGNASLYNQTAVLSWLGRCLSVQGQFSVAAEHYQRALMLAGTLDRTNDSVNRQIGMYHTDLALVLTRLGQHALARQEYGIALEISNQVKDNSQKTDVLGALGTLALSENNLAEARRLYTEALESYRSIGDKQAESIFLHQLGSVARQSRDLEEAERCYKQSLYISENIGDLAGAASTCTSLGNISEDGGRAKDAERWHRKAIALAEPLENQKDLALYHNNLAHILLLQNQLDEAESCAYSAVKILETLDLSAQPWNTYYILAEIAKKRGQLDKSIQWRRREQETRLAFEVDSQADTNTLGVCQEADQWSDVVAKIVVVDQAKQPDIDLDNFLDMMATKKVWRNLIIAIRRILNGERGMELFDDLDDINSAIVRRVLKGLLMDGEIPTSKHSPQKGEEQGVTLPQLLEYIERAAKSDKELGGQLFTAFQQMSRADDPTSSALGNVLLRVLVGEREPDLSKLPDEVASAVRGMLGRLKQR